MAPTPPKVILHFDTAISASDGARYLVRACGRETELGTWEGWLEFEPVAEGEVLRTPRETTQPDERATLYWATGLSEVYLEGALQRARDAATEPRIYTTTEELHPAYDRPAPDLTARTPPAAEHLPRAVLDPFAVYVQGEQLLHDELRALDESHLLNIIIAYRLASDSAELRRTRRDELARMIVERVKAGHRETP